MLILFRQRNRTRASTRSIAWAAETVRNNLFRFRLLLLRKRLLEVV